MKWERFRELCDYVDFTEADVRTLSEAIPCVEPAFGEIIDAFYAALAAGSATRRFVEDPVRVAHLKATLRQWLVETFTSPRDAAYLERRNRVGKIHVEIGLAQVYVFAAMALIRNQMETVMHERIAEVALRDRARRSLHKALDIDLAIFSDSYLDADKTRELIEKERLAAIGTMAVTLAHEVRNPLSGISGALQILSERAGPDPSHAEVHAEVQNQIRRLDHLVENLLQLGRPMTVRPEPTAIAPLVKQTFSILSEGADFRRVSLRMEGGAGDLSAPVDPARIQQALMNLFMNAAQAMRGEGKIRVAIDPERTGEGEALLVRIMDSGPGIPEGVAERLFQPFFTTKPKGSGLGLSICRRIVEAHGGTIDVKRDGSPGAEFRIRLPLRGAS